MDIIKTITGSNIQISDSNGDKLINIELQGNTTQNETPTPSSPVDIDVVTGTQTITISDGTNSNSYEIDLGNIELCKISDYQDRIYKNNGKWYLEKNIGNVVLDGTETWNKMNWSSKNAYRTKITNLKILTSGNHSSYLKSDRFEDYSTNGLFNLEIPANGISHRTNQNEIIIRDDTITSVNDFKTWLGTNNTIVYYAFETPVIEEITNTALISQLENVSHIQTYYGVTNITTNGDLSAILKITYYSWNRYINPSDRQSLLNNTCTIPFRLTFNDNNETQVITESNIINVSYEDFRYVDAQSLIIGQFVARKIIGTLTSVNTNINVEDTDVLVEMGIKQNESDNINWYSLGNFLITKPTNNDVKDIIEFEALDYTKKFNVEFDATNVTFPCTALELATAVCNQCGVTLGTIDFTNYNFVITDNPYVEKESCRKVMQDIGKLAYSWVRIGWDNKCYIDYEVKDTINTSNEITTNKYYELNRQEKVFGPVNRIVVGMSNVEGENVVLEDPESIAEYGATEIQIYDNNLTYTEELRRACINGASRLFGLTYTPLDITTVGHPWLIDNKKIKITDTNNTILYTYPFNKTIEYMGHIKTKLESKAETKTETEYRNTNTLTNDIKKTQIIVNKQEGEIQELASKIVDVSNTITNVGGITLENAHEGYLHYLSIYGQISLLYPNDNIYPKSDLYALDSVLIIDNTEYHLDLDYLNYMSSEIYDEFIYEDGVCKIIRRVGINNGVMYELEEEIIEERESVFLQVKSDSQIRLKSLPNAHYKVTYLLENNYTDTFASQVEVKGEIKTTADGINLEVSKKVGNDEIISKINQSPEQISINANKISLLGKNIDLTSDEIKINSTYFKVDTYGHMECTSAKLQGTIENYSKSTGTLAIEIDNTNMNFYDYKGDGDRVGTICSVRSVSTEQKGLSIHTYVGSDISFGYKDNYTSSIHTLMSFDTNDLTSTPWVKNTKNGTLFPSAGGITVENGFIKNWNLNTVSGTLHLKGADGYSDPILTIKNGLITDWNY